MTAALVLNQQRIEFTDFPEVNVDEISERCGEVFITITGTLIFNCALCEKNYGSVDNYLDHLAVDHYKDELEEKEVEYDDENSVEKSSKNEAAALLEDKSQDKNQTLAHGSDKNDAGDINLYTDRGYEADGDCNNDDDDIEIDISELGNSIVDYDEVIESDDNGDDDDGDGDDGEDDDINDDDIDKYEEMLQKRTNEPVIAAEKQQGVNAKSQTQKNIAESSKPHTATKRELSPIQQLKSAVQRQINSRTFTCEVCGNKFETLNRLKRHLEIHEDESRHQCYVCEIAFNDVSNLKTHVERMHYGKKNYICSLCLMSFEKIYELRMHHRTHTGQRPYICDICKTTYPTSGRLNAHMKIHNESYNYTCEYCKKGFYTKARYEDHVVSHTKEKRFVCEICAASYPRRKALNRHKKSHVGEV